MGVMVEGKCNTSTWLTTYRRGLCIGAKLCHLTFPLSLILQASLATRYWFFILLNIALLLIEFIPSYQCFKESCPRLAALPLSSLFPRRCTQNSLCNSSSCDFVPERADMETDCTAKKEICVTSGLDKNEEQQRWVCFTFLTPHSFNLFIYFFCNRERQCW